MTAQPVKKAMSNEYEVPLFWLRGTCPETYLEQCQPLYILRRGIQDENLPSFSTIEEIAAFCLEEIYAIRPKGPYMIGGYCFFGIIALEIARLMKRQGHDVIYLFMIESFGRVLPFPGVQVEHPKKDESFKSRVIVHYRNISRLRYTEKTTYIFHKLYSALTYARIRNKTKTAVCRVCLLFGCPLPHSLVKFYVYGVHTRQLLNTYVPRRYHGRVVVFNTDKEYRGMQPDWSNIADEVMVHIVPGAEHIGHLGILKKPFVGIWAEYLNQYLQRARSHSPRKCP